MDIGILLCGNGFAYSENHPTHYACETNLLAVVMAVLANGDNVCECVACAHCAQVKKRSKSDQRKKKLINARKFRIDRIYQFQSNQIMWNAIHDTSHNARDYKYILYVYNFDISRTHDNRRKIDDHIRGHFSKRWASERTSASFWLWLVFTILVDIFLGMLEQMNRASERASGREKWRKKEKSNTERTTEWQWHKWFMHTHANWHCDMFMAVEMIRLCFRLNTLFQDECVQMRRDIYDSIRNECTALRIIRNILQWSERAHARASERSNWKLRDYWCDFHACNASKGTPFSPIKTNGLKFALFVHDHDNIVCGGARVGE